LRVEGGVSRVKSGKWRVESGGSRVEGRELKVESEERIIQSGVWRVESWWVKVSERGLSSERGTPGVSERSAPGKAGVSKPLTFNPPGRCGRRAASRSSPTPSPRYRPPLSFRRMYSLNGFRQSTTPQNCQPIVHYDSLKVLQPCDRA